MESSLKRLVPKEVKIFVHLFKTGLACFRTYCQREGCQDEMHLSEEKENLESFASLFTNLDARTFGDIMTNQMPLLYDCLVHNSAFQVWTWFHRCDSSDADPLKKAACSVVETDLSSSAERAVLLAAPS